MDKLTPQLNEIQLKQNIDSLVKQGAPHNIVQSYIDNYTKDTSGNYVLKNTTGKDSNSSGQPTHTKLGDFARTIVSPVATMLARPIQLGAEALGATDQQVNDATAKLGGYVAPTPQNGADLKKDFGRAIETVALGAGGEGLGALAKGGAAFGLGSSLENGNDLFSAKTALDTALGGAGGAIGGKLIGLVGKPLFNVAGKVTGEVTPTFLKDLASKGSDAVMKFAADHEVLPQAGKDVITAVGNKIDNIGTVAKDAIKTEVVPITNKVKTIIPKLGKTNSLDKSIEETMPLLDKNAKINALENTSIKNNTGVKRSGKLGTTISTPTEYDKAVGKVAEPYISGTKDYVTKVANINDGISTISEDLNNFADSKSAPANFEDIHNYIKDNLSPSETLKKDPKALESYTRATTGASDIVANALRKEADATGNYLAQTSSSPVRQARIELDQLIKEELDKNTFGTPQYYGVKAAQIDARNMLNSLQEDMIRYPGQLEQLNRYNEAIRTLENKGIKVDPAHEIELKDKFGLKSTKASEKAAQHIADEHQRMNMLYDARDNIINRNEGDLGLNHIKEYIKKHPTANFVAKTLGGALRVGTGVNLVSHL